VRLVLLDSVTQVEPQHAGCVVVTGSHAGSSVVKYARAVPAFLYVFNDAGIGKDEAGVVALAELERLGIATAAVSHQSARIGDARDTWINGVVSRTNRLAASIGVESGRCLRECVDVEAAHAPAGSHSPDPGA